MLFRLFAQSGLLVSELEERLDGAEIAEYMAYYELEPFGEMPANARNAQSCALMANMWSAKKSKKFNLSDFMLFAEKPKKVKRTPQELAAIFEGIKNKLNVTNSK